MASPRVDLATLLDDSRGIRNGAKEINVHIKRKSYMEAIANEPGMMYDFTVFLPRPEFLCHYSNENKYGRGLKEWQQ